MDDTYHVMVCVKQVPDAADVSIDPDTGTLNRADAKAVMNRPDYNAVEAALALADEMGEARVTAVTMGPPWAKEILVDAVAMGADDGVLITDRAFAGSDTWPTSLALARAAESFDADVVVCGEESTDSSTGQVPPGVAAHNDWAQLTYVESLGFDDETGEVLGTRAVEGGHETLAATTPVVVAVEYGANAPRIAGLHRTIYAQTEFEPTELSAADLEIEDQVGLAVSPTSVGGMETAEPVPRERTMVESVDELADALREAEVLA